MFIWISRSAFVLAFLATTACTDTSAAFSQAFGSTRLASAETPAVTRYKGLKVQAPIGYCFERNLGGSALVVLPCGAIDQGIWPDNVGAMTLSVMPTKQPFPEPQALAAFLTTKDGLNALGATRAGDFLEQSGAIYTYARLEDPSPFGEAAQNLWRVLGQVNERWVSLRVSGYNEAQLSRADGLELAKLMYQELLRNNQGQKPLPSVSDLFGIGKKKT